MTASSPLISQSVSCWRPQGPYLPQPQIPIQREALVPEVIHSAVVFHAALILSPERRSHR